jgi:hypothetical protein
MDLDSLRIGRERLSRVFQYLEALNQHHNPPKRQIREQLWTLWLKDLPDHPALKCLLATRLSFYIWAYRENLFELILLELWRRGGDSNPRYKFWLVQRFSKFPIPHAVVRNQ